MPNVIRMRLTLFQLACVALAALGCGTHGSTSAAPSGASIAGTSLVGSEVPRQIDTVLKEIRKADTGELAVSEEDGRFLRLLAVSNHAQRALEIGAASGYSAIWLGLGLRETGGRLITIEYDGARAARAAENVGKAGLADVVQVIAGDGFVEIPKLTGSFDLVFLDAWKRDYKRFFDLVFPRLQARGLFLAHNVVNKRDEMQDFLSAIAGNPALLSAIVMPSGEGVLVAYRR